MQCLGLVAGVVTNSSLFTSPFFTIITMCQIIKSQSVGLLTEMPGQD
jgi:hypothetical protein